MSSALLIASRSVAAKEAAVSKRARKIPLFERSIQGPWPAHLQGPQRVWLARDSTVSLVKGKPERIAESGKRALGGIGLCAFQG